MTVSGRTPDGGPADDRTPDDLHPAVRAELPPDERELLAAFDRLSPEGSLQWGFDDALRRVKASVAEVPDLAPWPGLPGDLWERGRSARIGGRFVGDVAGVLAGLLADDARAEPRRRRWPGPTSPSGMRCATWQRASSSSRSRVDPLGLARPPLDLPAPEVGGLLSDVVRFVLPDDGPGTGSVRTILVGELGDRTLWSGLSAGAERGGPVRGVDPRAAVVWRSWPPDPSADRSGIGLVTAEVDAYLRSLDDDSVGSVVLSGCVDHYELARKIELVDQALRVTAPGGRLALLVSDQSAWDGSLAPPVRDLLPGRPLHPETWELLLAHRGVRPRVLPPDGGTASAVLAVVES